MDIATLMRAQVSIHARHCCRANPASVPWHHKQAVFQSTPGIAAGRIQKSQSTGVVDTVFQSTPGIAAGRIARKGAPADAAVEFQSTPGIAAGRINQR